MEEVLKAAKDANIHNFIDENLQDVSGGFGLWGVWIFTALDGFYDKLFENGKVVWFQVGEKGLVGPTGLHTHFLAHDIRIDTIIHSRQRQQFCRYVDNVSLCFDSYFFLNNVASSNKFLLFRST